MSGQLIPNLILVFPLVGFFINGILYKKNNLRLAGGIGSLAVSGSFLFSCLLFLSLRSSGQTAFEWSFFSWIVVDEISIDFAFSFNRLSALMCLIITGVGMLIHIFSVEYMRADKNPHRYFAYLNLFIFNMLILVLGKNLLITFIGWEGVGLCSYLLIGYWYTDPAKAAAGMKAFVVNRIGDAGFLIGMIILYLNFGSLDYEVINEVATSFAGIAWFSFPSLAVLAIFIGVAGKSAQAPLYVWLPDAMAGPTPVSALIHAATMVTAGVYVLFRLNGLLEIAPAAMSVVAGVGALTAFMASFIALSQWDIKKVLAYSTVSQLGYMVLAIGVGSYVGAVFHLLTHAFFKGLMFLGAGSVIHGLSGEQDIRSMGGLKKSMPVTYFTFLMGWLAIIGAPFFSGFFSKDEILYHTFISSRGGVFLWLVGLITAGITAFYMTRLMAKVFWGESNLQNGVSPHEGGVLFKLPLITLAFLSVVSGFLGVPHIFGAIVSKHFLLDWLSPLLVEGHDVTGGSPGLEWVLMISSVLVVLASSGSAYLFYVKKDQKVGKILGYMQQPFLLRASRNFLYIDQIYRERIVSPFKEVAMSLWLFIDVRLIDNLIMCSSKSILTVGKISRTLQSGNLQTYVSIFVSLVAVFLIGVLFL